MGDSVPPVDEATVAHRRQTTSSHGWTPTSAGCWSQSRNDGLAGWVSIHREANPLITHWGTISRLQADPAFRGQGIGSALMVGADEQVARDEMHLDQLRLAVRGGMGLEAFYQRLGWTIAGRWPRALRFRPE